MMFWQKAIAIFLAFFLVIVLVLLSKRDAPTAPAQQVEATPTAEETPARNWDSDCTTHKCKG